MRTGGKNFGYCTDLVKFVKGRRVEAVGLPCSPDAHTRSIVSLESRCSSKRAVGGQSASSFEKVRRKRALVSTKR